MRTLLYVPVIHTSADLGSLAKDVSKKGVANLGQDMWKEHLMTVEGFWDAVSHYFDYVDEWGAKIYQDGMIANGFVGQKILEEGVKSGSRNYELVLRLVKGSAVLVKTEDFNLVKEERDMLLSITQTKSTTKKIIAFLKYKLFKNRLLNKRDKFIAKRISETLNEGEKGILFVGAFHNVKRWLPRDIQVTEIKDIRKIREYQCLLPFYQRHKKRFEELARYLVSKIES